MSEYEIMYLLSETLNRIWEGVMFWVGVSFAYLAASHKIGGTLNWPKVTLLSLLYLAFTVEMFEIMKMGAVLQSGYIADLRGLDTVKSIATEHYLIADSERWDSYVRLVCLFGMAFAALFYLPLNHYHLTKKNKK